MSETYLIFIVQGYEVMTQQGQILDLCTVELIDTSAEKAIERAKLLINKKFYRVSNIIERQKICSCRKESS